MDAINVLQTTAVSGEVLTEPLYLHLSITDPEVTQALTEAGEGRDRQEFALTALRIGILSLKAARGTVDGATVRSEGERLLVTLEERLSSHRQVLDEALGLSSASKAAALPKTCAPAQGRA